MRALEQTGEDSCEGVCAWEIGRGHDLYETPIFFKGLASNFLSPRANALSAKYILQIKSSGLIYVTSGLCLAQQLPHFPEGLHSVVHAWVVGP